MEVSKSIKNHLFCHRVNTIMTFLSFRFSFLLIPSYPFLLSHSSVYGTLKIKVKIIDFESQVLGTGGGFVESTEDTNKNYLFLPRPSPYSSSLFFLEDVSPYLMVFFNETYSMTYLK